MVKKIKITKTKFVSKEKYKICISGAAGGECTITAKQLAFEVGRAIAKNRAILITGATTGIPHEAARGAKSAGGVSFGFSPATTRKEHLNTYKLPIDYYDVIVYTGFGYAGRNLLLTRASDAVIIVCGRIGTLNEFTIAFEDRKVIGILQDSGGVTDELDRLLRIAQRGRKNIIFESDPATLIKKVTDRLKKENRHG